MAGSKSDALEADVLKAITYQATTVLVTTPPGTGPWVGLFSVAPSDTGGGTEATGTGYARIDTHGKWGAPTGTTPTQVANNAIVTFAQAGGDWSVAANQVAFGLFTALSAGTLLSWGTLTTPKPVLNGDTPSFAVGSLILTED